MKLKSLFIVMLLPLFASAQNNFTLHGSFNAPQSKKWIYLQKFGSSTFNSDSAKIIDGMFTFSGKVKIPEMYVLHYRMGQITGVAPLFIEPGNLNVVIDVNNWYMNSKVTGGKVNDENNRLNTEIIEKFAKRSWTLDAQVSKMRDNDPRKKVLSDSIKKLEKEQLNFETQYIRTYSSSPVSCYELFAIKGNLKFDELGELLKKLRPNLHKSMVYKKMYQYYQLQQKLKNNIFEYSDSKLIVIKQASSKSFLKMIENESPGKVLYVDIWAIWCGPCLKEMPFAEKLNSEIDNKKIQMVYICVDSKPMEWEKTIESMKIKGKHYLVDNDLLGKFYSQTGIKTNELNHHIIIGKDGKVKYADAPAPDNPSVKKLLVSLSNE